MQDLQGKSQVELFLDRTEHYLKPAIFFGRIFPGRGGGMGVRPVVHLVDGEHCSIQASTGHYCSFVDGHWREVEIWNLSSPAPSFFSEYGDGEDPYAYVPIELVDLFVAAHGGIDWERTLANRDD